MDTIILPPKAPGKPNENWQVQALVVTGANGSGKTRFGAWIEANNPDRQVHRIAAQRALNLPDLVNPMPYERATSSLYYGRYEPSWTELQRRQNKVQTLSLIHISQPLYGWPTMGSESRLGALGVRHQTDAATGFESKSTPGRGSAMLNAASRHGHPRNGIRQNLRAEALILFDGRKLSLIHI